MTGRVEGEPLQHFVVSISGRYFGNCCDRSIGETDRSRAIPQSTCLLHHGMGGIQTHKRLSSQSRLRSLVPLSHWIDQKLQDRPGSALASPSMPGCWHPRRATANVRSFPFSYLTHPTSRLGDRLYSGSGKSGGLSLKPSNCVG